jgi:hypothetical protein
MMRVHGAPRSPLQVAASPMSCLSRPAPPQAAAPRDHGGCLHGMNTTNTMVTSLGFSGVCAASGLVGSRRPLAALLRGRPLEYLSVCSARSD